MSVLEFLRMFSFSDKEYFDELVGKLKEIMSAIFPEDKKKLVENINCYTKLVKKCPESSKVASITN